MSSTSQNIEFIFPLTKYLDCLPFSQKFRSSSILQKIGRLPLAKILKVMHDNVQSPDKRMHKAPQLDISCLPVAVGNILPGIDWIYIHKIKYGKDY